MNQEWDNIIEKYFKWIKDNTEIKLIRNGSVAEITTPYLDRHNDHLEIFIERLSDNHFLLSDDGYILSDLEMSGFQVNSSKRSKALQTILNGLGVSLKDNREIIVEANSSNIGQKKHYFIQALLAINDLYLVSQESVMSFFKEDVELFFKSQNIFFSKDIKLSGKTGFDHNVDFLVPASQTKSERLIKTINNPKKDIISSTIFMFNDIGQLRENTTNNFIVYNDEVNSISPDLVAALENYGIKNRAWSQRQEWVDELVVV